MSSLKAGGPGRFVEILDDAVLVRDDALRDGVEDGRLLEYMVSMRSSFFLSSSEGA